MGGQVAVPWQIAQRKMALHQAPLFHARERKNIAREVLRASGVERHWARSAVDAKKAKETGSIHLVLSVSYITHVTWIAVLEEKRR